MDLHHGTVNLDSTLGKGSTFTLLIPEGNAHFAEDRYEIVCERNIIRPCQHHLPGFYFTYSSPCDALL